jgi:hypothetical protein
MKEVSQISHVSNAGEMIFGSQNSVRSSGWRILDVELFGMAEG